MIQLDTAARGAATLPDQVRVAVLIPCYNEERTIADTVANFRTALPGAEIYVYDNNSGDRTSEVARAAGAFVRRETLQGKGNVVRRMFADVEADVYVMIDGDNTYDAPSAPALIAKLWNEQLDMVVGSRQETAESAYRPGHRFGNRLLTGCVAWIFGNRFGDMLSGYRVFSRRFVKSFPALAAGFETETELTVHALQLRMPVAEMATPYYSRPEGSVSKLSTYRDGIRILRTIMVLTKEERPLAFFSLIAAFLALISLALGTPIVIEFMRTGLVPRFPTALLAASVMLLAFLSLVCGLVLDTVTRGRHEIKRLRYLEIAAPGTAPSADRR
jgi:glycosyltransferase involved in cell wall biosynthesis